MNAKTEQIRVFIENELSAVEGSIAVDQDLFRSGVLDSLSFIKLLVFLEENFNVKFKRTEVVYENFKSLEQMMITIADPGKLV